MCVCVQVRVFVHSATGQIREEVTEEQETDHTQLNDTTTKSVAMEMTLTENQVDNLAALSSDQVYCASSSSSSSSP